MVIARFILNHPRSVLSALGAMCVAAMPAPAIAQATPAGIIIESTAEATYEDAGVARTASSNLVQVQVGELLGVAVAGLDAGAVAARPGTAVLGFTVNNIGNGPEAFTLEVVTSLTGNAFDSTLDSVAVDTNGNGVYDAGIDAVLPAPVITGVLAAGAAETVFVIVTVPAGVTDGAQSSINLIARAATGTGTPGTNFAAAGESGVDAIVGPSGGMAVATGQMVASTSTVTLVKWATVTDPFGGAAAIPGATITYGIEALVTGSAPVDGLVITDAIPANTQYVAGSLALDGASLSDAAGDDAGEASPAGISVNLGTVAGGTPNTITFAVLVEE